MTAEMIAYGIDYIYYIVAHLLKVIYDVHIVDTRLIFVYAVVDVLHIVGAHYITFSQNGSIAGHTQADFPCR